LSKAWKRLYALAKFLRRTGLKARERLGQAERETLDSAFLSLGETKTCKGTHGNGDQPKVW